MTVEDVAESYFDELISRNVILVAGINIKGKLKACQVHDMILEFSISKSREENLYIYRSSRSMLLPTDAIRRLSIQSVQSGREDLLEHQVNLSHVRSLAAFFFEPKPTILSSKLKLLRVLNLDGCQFDGTDDLEVLGEFPHLKCLSLRNIRGIRLPSSIGKLQNLEILDCKGSDLLYITSEIINLKKLQYILLDPDTTFAQCRGIGTLANLKVLFWIDLDEIEGVARELGELILLAKLGVRFSKQDVGAEFGASLSNLRRCLRSLIVQSPDLSSTMNHITSTPLLLEKLGFIGYLGTLPGWVAMLPNLAKLILKETKLRDDAFQALSELPNLSVLTLEWNSYVGNQMCFGPQGFGCLKELIISFHLKSLRFEEGAMPNLEEFRLLSCIIEEADDLGLEHLTNLKNVWLILMQQRMVNTVRAALEAHPKKPKLEAIYTRRDDEVKIRLRNSLLRGEALIDFDQ